MKKYEKELLSGIFLTIISIFIPWQGIIEYYKIHGGNEHVGTRIEQTIIGHEYIAGWAILICPLVLLVLTFIKKSSTLKNRFFAANCFFIFLIIALFIIKGVTPIFKNKISPHIGLLSLLIGCIILLQGLRDMKSSAENR